MRRIAPLLLAVAVPVLSCKKKEAPPPPPPALVVERPDVVSESEPNDESRSPQMIAKSSDITGSFAPTGGKVDDDWYKIDVGPAKKALSADLSSVPGTDTFIEVYDADRNKLFKVNLPGEDVPERVPNVLVDRALYLRVGHAKKETAGGSYTLQLRIGDPKPGEELEPNDKWVTATPLQGGATITGYIAHPDDEDWYAVDLRNARGVLHVELSGVPNVRTELGVALGTSQGVFQTVRANDLGETLTIRNLGIAPTETTYYVIVRGAPFRGKQRTYSPTDRYALSASFEEAGSEMEFEPNEDAAHASEITLDQRMRTGYLAPKSDVDWFVIRGASEQPYLLRAELVVPDRTDMQMTFFRVPVKEDGTKDDSVAPDSDKAQLFKVNEGGLREPEVLPTIYIPPAQDTYVRIEGAFKNLDGKWLRDYENTREPYRLMLNLRPEAEQEEREPNNTRETATPIRTGLTLKGFIAPRKDSDYYLLEVEQAGPVRVSCTGILKVDVAVFLLDEDGDILTSADKGRGETEEKFEFNLEPGTYYVQVKDGPGGGSNTSDAYQLSVR